MTTTITRRPRPTMVLALSPGDPTGWARYQAEAVTSGQVSPSAESPFSSIQSMLATLTAPALIVQEVRERRDADDEIYRVLTNSITAWASRSEIPCEGFPTSSVRLRAGHARLATPKGVVEAARTDLGRDVAGYPEGAALWALFDACEREELVFPNVPGTPFRVIVKDHVPGTPSRSGLTDEERRKGIIRLLSKAYVELVKAEGRKRRKAPPPSST